MCAIKFTRLNKHPQAYITRNDILVSYLIKFLQSIFKNPNSWKQIDATITQKVSSVVTEFYQLAWINFAKSEDFKQKQWSIRLEKKDGEVLSFGKCNGFFQEMVHTNDIFTIKTRVFQREPEWVHLTSFLFFLREVAQCSRQFFVFRTNFYLWWNTLLLVIKSFYGS